ncbi:MAG: response regulator transcription factor [Candidatus Kapabacteria bacterium]|nr:response regulator transcription factor [Candidatus Kapabacteria bacterium]
MRTALVVEDEVTLAQHLQGLLESIDCAVFTAHDIHQAEDLTTSRSFNVILLDLQLHGVSAVDLCRRIRSKDQNVPIIVLTAFSDLDTKMQVFENGADDFISKPFHGRELLAKVNVFLRRSQRGPETADEIRVADLIVDQRTKSVYRGGTRIPLTPKEFQLLALLAENVGAIVSKAEIAKRVWNVGFDAGTNTVEVYMSLLRQKIDKPFDTKLLHTRQGFGYSLSEREP